MSDNWQNKIFNYEETPPKGAWGNIAKMLDETDDKKEITTPIAKKTTKIIYWRIAAAASIIAVIATTAIWINAGTKNTEPVLANVTVNKISQDPSIKAETPLAFETVKSSKTSSEILPAKNKKAVSTFSNINTNNNTKIQYVKANAAESLTGKPTLNKTEKLTNTSGDIPNDIALMNTPNNYVSFIGPNGQEVKVSSKFSNLLGYMDGKDPEAEENLDRIINESSFWRGKFKIWRNKMINNSIAPSPANFMDIIELSKFLQENK